MSKIKFASCPNCLTLFCLRCLNEIDRCYYCHNPTFKNHSKFPSKPPAIKRKLSDVTDAPYNGAVPEEVLDYRREYNHWEVLIRWMGFGDDHATWENLTTELLQVPVVLEKNKFLIL